MRYLLPFLLAATLSAGEVQLSWQDNSENELGFEVERKELGGEFESVWITFADTEEWTDDVEPGTYEYRVRAFNKEGYSGYTNELEATAADPPNDPSGLKRDQQVLSIITNDDGSITIKPVSI